MKCVTISCNTFYLHGFTFDCRLLRAIKNRFGACGELGIFKMDSDGMTVVANPSEMFLSTATESKGVSSAISVVMEGNRPLLLEIQALTNDR